MSGALANDHRTMCGDEVRLDVQSLRGKRAPGFIRGDLYVICSLLGLAPVAALARQQHWPAACRVLGRAVHVGRTERQRTEAGIRRALGGGDLAAQHPPDAVYRGLEAHRLELRCQVLRDLLRRDWRPEIRIEGADRLEQALSRGQGLILWVSRFVFADTIAKIGLWRLGHPPVHLSRTIHGFSHSEFGKRWLNPLAQRMENRYLAERVMVNEDQPGVALRRLHDVLVANGLVSISVHHWGSHVAELPFLNARIRIATGAPSLARKTGARLMPVFTIREPGSDAFRLIMDEPLPIDRAQTRSEVQRNAVTLYVRRLEHHVAAHPSQWQDWSVLRDR